MSTVTWKQRNHAIMVTCKADKNFVAFRIVSEQLVSK